MKKSPCDPRYLVEAVQAAALEEAQRRENLLRTWHEVIVNVACSRDVTGEDRTGVLSVTLGPRRLEPYSDGRYHVRVRVKGRPV